MTIKIEDFSYLRCLNCDKVMVYPIPLECNSYILSKMCIIYDKIHECCKTPNFLYGNIKQGISQKNIKIEDLPFVLRKKFQLEVKHKFACGKHSLLITKHNGDKITISIEGNEVIIDIGGLSWSIYNIGD